jgi:energy-coupling factor transport system ATP-binding protein
MALLDEHVAALAVEMDVEQNDVDIACRELGPCRLERLRLAHLAGASPFTLSGGEQRRLSVATALATAPPLLVLDEPTFGQDRRTYAELVALLATHREAGGGVLFASHDEDLVASLADRTIAMRRGTA